MEETMSYSRQQSETPLLPMVLAKKDDDDNDTNATVDSGHVEMRSDESGLEIRILGAENVLTEVEGAANVDDSACICEDYDSIIKEVGQFGRWHIFQVKKKES